MGGHVWRAEDTLIKKVTESKITGKRPRGRPRQRWYDRVKKDLKKINPLLDMGELERRLRSGDGPQWTAISLRRKKKKNFIFLQHLSINDFLLNNVLILS